jgi:membrane protein
VKRVLEIFFKSFYKTIEHDGIEHAGYMAFLALLALFPALLLFLVATNLLGAPNIGNLLVLWLLNNLPYSTTEAIRPHIAQLGQMPAQSLMGLAVFGSIWTASSFVEGIRTILNRIYRVHSPPRYLMRRLLSLMQFFIIGACIFIAIMLLVVIPELITCLPEMQPAIAFLSPAWQQIRYITLFGILLVMTSLVYYLVPNIKLSLPKVLPGATVTVFLWIIAGRILASWAAYYSQLNLIYGPLGSIIISLLLFYISNIIFIYGAELNYLLSGAEKNE